MSIIDPPPKMAAIHIFEIIDEQTYTPETGKYYYKLKFLDPFFHEGQALLKTDKPIEDEITLTPELAKQLKELRKKQSVLSNKNDVKTE